MSLLQVSPCDRQPRGRVVSCSLNTRVRLPKVRASESQTQLPGLYLLSALSRRFTHLKDHYIFETFLKNC